MLNELNVSLYNASYQTLTEHGVSKTLADVASRIVATDDPTQPDLGRNEVDQAICREVAIQVTINSQQ